MILFGMKIMGAKKSAKNVSDYYLAEHLAINYPKQRSQSSGINPLHYNWMLDARTIDQVDSYKRLDIYFSVNRNWKAQEKYIKLSTIPHSKSSLFFQKLGEGDLTYIVLKVYEACVICPVVTRWPRFQAAVICWRLNNV